MGKKPFVRLAGLLLAGLAVTATGCGTCTSCNTRPGKFNTGSTFGKGPTPAVGDKKAAPEVAGDPAIKPAPTPPLGAEVLPTGGSALPPGGPVGALKKEAPPITPVSMQDNLPGRSPLDDATAATPTRASFPVPPTPQRSSIPSDGIPATPVPKKPELPTNTMTPPPAIPSASMPPASMPPAAPTAAEPPPPPLPPAISTSVPMEMPPPPKAPASSTPGVPPVPGTGGTLPGIPLPDLR